MRIDCTRCGTPNRLGAGRVLSCEFCCARIEVTRTMLRRARAEAEAEEIRGRRMPLNIAAAVGLFAVTLFLLIAMNGRHWAGSLLSEVSFWLFPLWTTALIIGAISLARFDRRNEFALLKRAAAVMLVALTLPLVYEAVPKDVRTGNWQALAEKWQKPAAAVREIPRIARR